MNTVQYFINEQSDFYHYLIETNAFKSRQTYRDYITRLKYVSRFFRLDKTLTKEQFEFIMEELRRTSHERTRYNTPSGIRDIGSGLKKFLEYAQSDYRKHIQDSVISEVNSIKEDNSIETTEKEAIIISRVGQGVFRLKLISYWNGCSITGCKNYPLLMASHIKPWRKSNNKQRLDPFNGLLLLPNLDKLFDKGYISFDNKGRMICSDFLPDDDRHFFGVSQSMRLRNIDSKHFPYLQYHREHCLL